MKRILVAHDGSPRAASVLDAAIRLAETARAKLVLYRAISVSPELPRDVLLAEGELEGILISRARAALEKVAATAKGELVESIVAELAIPWDGICRAARAREADLIVIGSHGYGGLDRLLGTVAGKVVNHADRNVLVVRTPL